MPEQNLSVPDSTRARVFAAIELAPALVSSLKEFQNQLRQAVNSKAFRWTQSRQMHLTLKFYGNVLRQELPTVTVALKRAAQNISPFELAIQGIGCFPNNRSPRIIWAAVQGNLPQLHLLQSAIDENTARFAESTEQRAYHPHLTLARFKGSLQESRRAGQVIQSAPPLKLPPWQVAEFQLIESKLSREGPHYSTLATIALESAS